MSQNNRVTIASGEKQESGTSKNGKAFTERYQEAYLHEVGKPYPTSCRLPLWDNARPYPTGEFQTAQELEISEFGRLQVKRDLVLSPFTPAAK